MSLTAAGDCFPPECGAVIKDWLRGLTPCTRVAYSGDLGDFAKFVGLDTSLEALRVLVEQGPGTANVTAMRYKTYLTERKLSSATVARRISALKSAIALLRTAGIVVWRLEVRLPKVTSYRDTRGPGVEGVRAMLGAIQGGSEKALRDRAIVRLLFDLALRREEAVSLDVEHLDFSGKRLWIKGKARGGEREAVTLPEPTANALRAYLKVRGNPSAGPLIMNIDRACKGSGRLTGDGVRKILISRATSAGIGKIRPHGLRHAAITAALDAGRDAREVLRFSRHKDPRTLFKYDDARQDFAGQVAADVAKLL
jgi:integrase/recombinase XerC